MPKELINKENRLKKIEDAKNKLKENGLEKINVTDNDANIMMHNDGAKKLFINGQVAIDSKEQIIVAANLVTDANDVDQVNPMIQRIFLTMGCNSKIVLADAGYFSYENLILLKSYGIDAYIPDNFFKVEENGNGKWLERSLFRFDKEKDCYYCPAEIVMPFTRIQKRKDAPDLRLYVCNFCPNCIFKKACTKAENRTISKDPREYLLVERREKLKSDEGKKLYNERMLTVEPVFGQMKQNRGFQERILEENKRCFF